MRDRQTDTDRQTQQTETETERDKDRSTVFFLLMDAGLSSPVCHLEKQRDRQTEAGSPRVVRACGYPGCETPKKDVSQACRVREPQRTRVLRNGTRASEERAFRRALLELIAATRCSTAVEVLAQITGFTPSGTDAHPLERSQKRSATSRSPPESGSRHWGWGSCAAQKHN